jgi:hypothetical protein
MAFLLGVLIGYLILGSITAIFAGVITQYVNRVQEKAQQPISYEKFTLIRALAAIVFWPIVLRCLPGEALESLKEASAIVKSKELLMSFLTEAEKEEFNGYGYVTVTVDSKRYRVFKFGKVKRLEDNNEYCIVFTQRNMPDYDTMLMKIALLKTDPQKFFGTAIPTKPHDPNDDFYRLERERPHAFIPGHYYFGRFAIPMETIIIGGGVQM